MVPHHNKKGSANQQSFSISPYLLSVIVLRASAVDNIDWQKSLLIMALVLVTVRLCFNLRSDTTRGAELFRPNTKQIY